MAEVKFERKLIAIGTGLGFTIPNEIIETYNLEKGDICEMDVINKNDETIIILKKIKLNEEESEI